MSEKAWRAERFVATAQYLCHDAKTRAGCFWQVRNSSGWERVSTNKLPLATCYQPVILPPADNNTRQKVGVSKLFNVAFYGFQPKRSDQLYSCLERDLEYLTSGVFKRQQRLFRRWNGNLRSTLVTSSSSGCNTTPSARFLGTEDSPRNENKTSPQVTLK